MRTPPSLDPRINRHPPSVLYLSSTSCRLGFSSSGGCSVCAASLEVGLRGGSAGGGGGFCAAPNAGDSKRLPDHSEMHATHGAKW